MKRTVYNTMIGLMLVCGLAITSTGAMAQGRRPASNSNAAAAGNRSVATASPKNNAVVTNSNTSSRSTMGSAVTDRSSSVVVNKPSTSSSSTTTTRPQAGNRSAGGNNGNSGNSGKNSGSNGSNVRPSTGGNNGGSMGGGNHSGSNGNSGSTVRPSTGGGNTGGHSNSGSGSTVRPNTGNSGGHSGNNGGTVRPNIGGGNNSGNVRPNGGNNNGKGHTTAPSSRPKDNKPKVSGKVMTGGGPKIDYKTYRYNNSLRPRHDGDRFFNSFRYNSWSWNKPIRPSVRLWRPSTIWVYRPIVTVNISHYSSYPTIAGVLGLSWGTSFGNALNYLYYNGYYIDGFENSIVYLTDVELLGFDWDDVMLQFDGNDNLDYVEFAYWTSGYDTSRFFSLYNDLCSMYGSPVSYTNSMYSWYGGDGIGFVNLGLDYSTDVCYTVLAFGV